MTEYIGVANTLIIIMSEVKSLTFNYINKVRNKNIQHVGPVPQTTTFLEYNYNNDKYSRQ